MDSLRIKRNTDLLLRNYRLVIGHTNLQSIVIYTDVAEKNILASSVAKFDFVQLNWANEIIWVIFK